MFSKEFTDMIRTGKVKLSIIRVFLAVQEGAKTIADISRMTGMHRKEAGKALKELSLMQENPNNKINDMGKSQDSSSSSLKEKNTTNNGAHVYVQAKVDNEAVTIPTQFDHDKTMAILGSVPQEKRQIIVDEWVTALQNRSIKSPLGYLFALVKREKEGQFVSTAPVKAKPVPVEPPKPIVRASITVINSALQDMRSKLGKRTI